MLSIFGSKKTKEKCAIAKPRSNWLEPNEQKAIDQRIERRNQVQQQDQYVFKSLLRQDYFNKRFKSKDIPTNMRNQECRRIAQNLIVMSELLLTNASHLQQDSSFQQGIVKYCATISSQRGAYLLKYFPYQCLSCARFSNEILIVQCRSEHNEEMAFEK